MDIIETLVSTYHFPLVLLSILVAVFSASAALEISNQLKGTNPNSPFKWIFTGSFILGLGIWSMHFIGMLAFHISVDVTYQVSMVMLSIIPAIISCGAAFYIVSRGKVSQKSLIIGAFFIGTGIISMHHIGMKAMQMEAVISYDPILWGVSVVIALAASYIGLYLMFYLPDVPRFHWRKIASALLIGIAVSGMHYTGMAAAQFAPSSQDMAHSVSSSIDNSLLAYGIGAGMLLILASAFISVQIDRRLKAHSEESELKFKSVIESAKDAIIVADFHGSIIQWNRGAERIFGYSSEEILGSNIDSIIPRRLHEDYIQQTDQYGETKIAQVIGQTVELMGSRKDGSEFPLEMSLGSWETEKGMFFSSIIRDITERKISEEKINDLVYLDPLTGLPNRRLFNDRLTSLLEQSKETQATFSLFYMDLDNFKMINDRFGHAFGDLFLKNVTERLKHNISSKDTLSRVGGDEFVLLLPNTEYSQAASIATRLGNALNEPFQLEGEEIFTSLSVGISLYPSDGRESNALIKNADIAMYQAKEDGKNGFQFFTQSMNESISRKSNLATGLRKGIEHGEFAIHYQPQISLDNEEIIGVEALIRWTHPEWGNISPAEFIPIAEETGSIAKIGEFVLMEACRQNKAWQEAGLPPFRVAVNISARQFAQADFPKIVETVLKESGLDAQYLELELTETVIQNDQSAIATMQELSSLGLHLSIDDFGTGYSSLSYLKLFPIRTLKIDQHFTRNIDADTKDEALVKTIIRMAHDLDLNVIAEGVETKEQLDFLKNQNCNQAQGYYFNRPLPPKEIEELYQAIQTG